MLGIWIIAWAIGYLSLVLALYFITSSEFLQGRHTVKITILCMILPIVAFSYGYLK